MSNLVILGGILCCLGLLQRILKSIFRSTGKRFPDGPTPLGVLGNIFTLRRLQSSPDRELTSIARRWGDICMLWAARYPILIVNKPQVAKELLVDVRLHQLSQRPD